MSSGSDAMALQLKELKTEARCNDGSAPAFYLRPGSSLWPGLASEGLLLMIFEAFSARNAVKSRFLLWLEGGGDCHDRASCDERFRSGYRMSSRGLPKTKALRTGVTHLFRSHDAAFPFLFL